MNFTKSILALAITSFLFVGCKEDKKEINATTTATTAKQIVPAEKLATASFNIEGMSCAVMCASKIEKELAAMDGVQKATVDFEKKTATIEYDNSKQTPEKFVEKVDGVADGKTYKVANVKSSEDHAMFLQEKEKKQSRKEKRAAKKAAANGEKSKDAKPACCSGKKHCGTDEKKANTL